MPRSLRARSSSASMPVLRSRTSAASCRLRSPSCSLSVRWVATARFRRSTSRTPSAENHTRYCSRRTAIASAAASHFMGPTAYQTAWGSAALARCAPEMTFLAPLPPVTRRRAIELQRRSSAGSDPERKRLPARVTRLGELGFDAQQLVVLGDAIRARQRAGLDLRGGGRDRDVG